MRNKLSTIAAGVAVLLVIGGCALPAYAQPKAALVQSQDEPGRHPYQFTFSGTNSFINSPVVPAGKRLVLQHISVRLQLSAPNDLTIRLQSAVPNPSTDAYIPLFFTQNPAFSTHQELSAPISGYVDAGGSVLILTGNFTAGQVTRGTLIGYLIDCTATSPCAAIAP